MEYAESGSIGFLSSLIGDGCECDGYNIRIVGHSLGSAIASLLGIRVSFLLPEDYIIDFNDNEFSFSIRRLQVAAIKVLSQDPKADTAFIFRLARRFLSASKRQRQNVIEETSGEAISSIIVEDSRESLQPQDQIYPIWEEAEPEMRQDDQEFINPFHDMASADNLVSQFMGTVPTREDDDEAPEMFLPGLVIHIVPEGNNMSVPIWRGWEICDVTGGYKAYVANRELQRNYGFSINVP